ncbi:efflux transporter, RND family, MFP subunit [Brevundimonas subvibrioides ATCC 15264]|uniref:Efflux transporter, RND family, MFP subunit n=1 Tax=Brevundimonas subvibrioides (strain ATCC 15264 / DSM 4735 / LMG 14903 / NBRC 16000 / CB 81) TaxID=633149 RepID=D9QGI1_BRESC|nr:efflux transporter, RND family, MFP subunit [Brevundimonas subvibrioides ATCC 15264]
MPSDVNSGVGARVIKRHFFLVAAAVVLGLMIVAAVMRVAFAGDEAGAGGPGGGRGGGRGQAVEAAVVVQRPFSDQINVLGVARGQRSVNITSSTSQLITRVLFRDGQRVAAGTPLVQLQAGEEEAGIIEARARVGLAETQYERYAALGEQGYAPRMMVEQYRAELATARATLQAALARQGDLSIRAPFAGTLGLSTVTAGTLISPGAVITTLDDTSVIRVDFPVPERYLGVLRSGLSITATADAYGNEQFSGRIALVDTRINETTRAVTARAEFPNPGGRIRPGMLMRVAIQQGQRQTPAVPEAAVQYEGDGAFVYRIAAGERGSTAQRVEVETGAVEGGYVEIVSGLNANDRVVAGGLNRIQPNAPVTVGGAGGAQRAGATAPTGAAARNAAAQPQAAAR